MSERYLISNITSLNFRGSNVAKITCNRANRQLQELVSLGYLWADGVTRFINRQADGRTDRQTDRPTLPVLFLFLTVCQATQVPWERDGSCRSRLAIKRVERGVVSSEWWLVAASFHPHKGSSRRAKKTIRKGLSVSKVFLSSCTHTLKEKNVDCVFNVRTRA